MPTFEVTFKAYQTVTVEADDYDDAEEKAFDKIDEAEWEEEVDDIDLISDDIIVLPNTCSSCKNCNGIDEYYGKVTCSIDRVPNGHNPGDTCCLHESNH